jgi:hypothetical protein
MVNASVSSTNSIIYSPGVMTPPTAWVVGLMDDSVKRQDFEWVGAAFRQRQRRMTPAGA